MQLMDIVLDNYGRRSIVVEETVKPTPQWLAMQEVSTIRKIKDADGWFTAFPMSGGSICVHESQCSVLGRATIDDIRECYYAANGFAKEKLKAALDIDGQ